MNRGGPRGSRSFSDGEAKKTDLAAWEIQQENGRLVRLEMSLVIFGRSRSSPTFLRRWESNKATTTGECRVFYMERTRLDRVVEVAMVKSEFRGGCAHRWVGGCKCNWSNVTWSHPKRPYGVCFPFSNSPIGWAGTAVAPPSLPCIRRLHLPSTPRGRAGLTPMASPGESRLPRLPKESPWCLRGNPVPMDLQKFLLLSMISISHSDPQH